MSFLSSKYKFNAFCRRCSLYFYYSIKNYIISLIRQSQDSQQPSQRQLQGQLLLLMLVHTPLISATGFKQKTPAHQCQFKCRTNLGCLRRLFRAAILEDEV
ncbi:Hypothetical_protein [Hexamita inflata]|uniref:Hypothetical_protein n=1 Tax=Hexamita inflata TaxID=28002 RepID=A0AA86U801_9EUKA|nr:Hypothetical protein HINF_LOCUS34290 [Hexamita inflata]